jgi:hypothetical protein
MIKRLLSLLAILITLALITSAQDAAPETTVEATAEVTAEATAAPDGTPEAQATEDPECPALVSTALDLTQDRCENTAVNEACYGYVLIESQSRTGEVAFDQPGDIVPLLDIQTLQLSSMDTSTGQWGVLEVKVEANQPVIGDDPDNPTTTLQDIQFVIFGDTELSDTGNFVQVTADETTPVYFQPDTTSESLDTLETGISTLASARLVGDEWVRIPVDLEDGESLLGWIAVENLSFDTDIAILPELTVEEAANPSASDLNSRFGPMQAFMFQSGIDDAPCSAAPNSGMLIQTPEGVASVTIVMDEVVIQLSGTGFVQAQPNGELRLDILDGEAQVTSDGETRAGVEGQSMSVDLDASGLPVGAPNDPEPLDLDNTQGLPIDLLDDDVEIADPFDLPDGVPVSGNWSLNYNVSALTCPDGSEWPFAAIGSVSVQAQQDGLLYAGTFHSQTGVGVYQGSYTVSSGDLYTNLLQVGATDRITGTTNIDFAERLCTLSVPFTLQLLGTN